MKVRTPLDDANSILIQRLAHEYLPLALAGDGVITVADACLTISRIGNRYGVPRDTTTYLIGIDHPDLGVRATIRTAWRCGDLHRPIATHTVLVDVELYDGDDGDAAREAINDWLQAVPLSTVRRA